MKRLKVGILDLLTNTPNEPWFQSHVMAPNFASITPQCVGVWAEELGHDVFYETFTGREDLERCLPEGLDVLFLSCFSRSSFLAYGLSAAYRKKGVVTVLGGPHARSFPEHAREYFDYVCLLTDKPLIQGLFQGLSRQERGVVLGAKGQPGSLPGVRARARFIDVGMNKGTSLFRVVPMLGSLGCPYTCGFCIDAPIPYKPMPFDVLVDDLRFAQERYGKNTVVGWHDPNFGVRFRDYMGAIEASGTQLMHVAESSLSLLKESNLQALKKANFVAMLPGIESWYECDAKGGAGKVFGEAKVKHVAEHVNLIMSYIPCVQTNFVIGLDSDVGEEPWRLTKQFVDLAPGAFPGYSLISDFQNAPMSADLAAANRVTKVPYPLLDNNFAINVRLKNYSPTEYYDRLIDLMEHTWSWGALWRRAWANRRWAVKAINFGRALSEGRGRLSHYRYMRRQLDEDREFSAFARGESEVPPTFFFTAIKEQMGKYAALVPADLLTPLGFVRSVEKIAPAPRIPAQKVA
ncbi:MAG: radical SAM protein [Myxococcota bacterium]